MSWNKARCKAGHGSRMIYGFRVHRGRKREREAFTWQDYRNLIL
ncbi:hypothetical protein ACFVV8_02145 [Streptomyces goshikiensis]